MMKKIFILLLLGLPALASTEKISANRAKDQKLALKLANLLLRQEISKCLTDAGFKGTKLLTNASAITASEKDDVTTFKIRIEKYEILPTDGTRLASTMNLMIQSTLVRTRAGHDQAITCSLTETPQKKE